MKLNWLQVQGFGKLVGLPRIELTPGLNLLFGENESGKTTLQQAIMAALYGFYSFSTANRGRPSESEAGFEARYKPWSGQPYACGIEYVLDDGRCYHLQRGFAGAESKLAIRDVNLATEVSGLDLGRCKSLPPDAVLQYIGASREAFTSSAFIGQGHLDSIAAPESLSAAFAAAVDTGSSGRPADKVIAALEKAADGLGKEAARSENSNRPLSDALRRQDLAQAEMDEWLRREQSVELQVGERERLRQEAAQLEPRLRQLHYAQACLELQRLEGIAAAVAAEEAEMARCREERCQRAQWAAFPSDRQGKIDEARVRLDMAEKTVREREQAAAGQAEQAARDRDEYGRLSTAIAARRALASFPAEQEGEVNRLWGAIESGRAGVMRLRAAASRAPAGESPMPAARPLGLVIVLAALALLVLVGGVIAGYALPGIAVAALLAIAAVILARPRAIRAPVHDGTALAIEQGQAELEREERQLRDLLLRSGIDEADLARGKAVFVERVGQWREFEQDKRREITLRESLKYCASLEEQLQLAREEVAARRAEAQELLRRCGIEADSLEEGYRLLAERSQARSEYERWQAEAQAAESRRDVALKGEQREGLDIKCEAARAEHQRMLAQDAALAELDTSSFGDRTAVATVMADLEEQQRALRSCMDGLDGAIHGAFDRLDYSRAEAEEKLALALSDVARLEHYKQALELARSCLDAAMVEARRGFAPDLGRALSDNVKLITAGRYEQAQVTLSTEVSLALVDRATGEARPSGWLSLGTREQCYICLRLALAGLLSERGERLPLILDDPFVNCDAPRLERMLSFLGQIAQEQQVLLFTKDPAIKQWFDSNLAPDPRCRYHDVGAFASC